MRTLLFFIILITANGAVAATCMGELLLQRRPLSREATVESLRFLFPHPVLRELEFMHVSGYHSLERGAIALKQFYPMWIFDHPQALELLVSTYPQSFAFSSESEVNAKYQGVVGFLKYWEELFRKAGGKFSHHWIGRDFIGRTYFTQKFFLELAYRQGETWNLEMGSQIHAEIQEAFGSVDKFQKELCKFIRAKKKSILNDKKEGHP